MTGKSNLNICILDDGVRREAWDKAAKAAGLSRMQWALRLLDEALPARTRKKLPPLKQPGYPAGRPRK